MYMEILEKYFENLRFTQPLSYTFKKIEESMIEEMNSSVVCKNHEEDVHRL